MIYLQKFFTVLALIRIIILSVTSFFLIQGILEIPVVHLPFWLDLSLLMCVLHIGVSFIRFAVYKNSTFAYPSLFLLFWVLFIKAANFKIFLVDNTFRTQTLFSAVTLAIIAIYLYQNLRRSFRAIAKFKLDSRLTIMLSFLLVIMLGTGLLVLPISSAVPGSNISLIDAFFTACSAVCVTGLIVIDTATQFSRFGQIVILVLIQIGSLGLVTITSVFINLIGQNLSVRSQLSAKDVFGAQEGDYSLVQFLQFVLGFTLAVELIIAVILFGRFITQMPFADAAFFSVFHAISAFCNAGFALFSNSFVPYRSDFWVNAALMSAIVIGGMGFAVWQDVKRYFEQKTLKLRLQSLIALRLSLILIIIGTALFWILENNNILIGMSPKEKFLSSLFASVNLRTAGFNSVDLSESNQASRFMSVLLMYIGASPGSTGGGIKTTTFMIILATVSQTVNHNNDIIIYGRRVAGSIVFQAWTLIFNSMIWITGTTLLICAVEPFSLSDALYETVSAYATVGVSTGITPLLSTFSKILIAITMILGRVGPTTVMLALVGKTAKKSLIRTPIEDLPIG